MSRVEPRRFAGPAGAVTLRGERAEDADFLFALFAANTAALLAPAGLDAAVLAHLTRMQHRSQLATYAARFPDARRWIVERDGAPVGRLVEADEGATVHIVDIAFLPEVQRTGLGSAVLGALTAAWAAQGRAVRSEVAVGNAASLAMHRKLGFVEAGPPVSAHLRLIRPALPPGPGFSPPGS